MNEFEQVIINSTDRTDLLVWWTSQDECEALTATNPLWSDYDATVDGVPDYIHSEFCSRYGRNGRGRLWVASQFGSVGIPWDETKPAARLAGERGGIVIWAKDAQVVFGLPGFLTDFELNVQNEVPT